MLMIVDGVYINQDDQPDYISSIMPDDIAGIEVLSSNYNTSVYGSEGYWGVVFITTKNGRGGSNPPSSNTISVRNRGFSKIKEFYAPNYDDPKTNTQMQDLRSTIYWNNNINTNENGKASFSFFNAGTPGNYKVIVEGMDTFGNIGRKVYTYEVK
jgi:outer membrane cobalamin receptor